MTDSIFMEFPHERTVFSHENYLGLEAGTNRQYQVLVPIWKEKVMDTNPQSKIIKTEKSNHHSPEEVLRMKAEIARLRSDNSQLNRLVNHLLQEGDKKDRRIAELEKKLPKAT